jgi:hypothetical protein
VFGPTGSNAPGPSTRCARSGLGRVWADGKKRARPFDSLRSLRTRACLDRREAMRPAGLEPATPGLEDDLRRWRHAADPRKMGPAVMSRSLELLANGACFGTACKFLQTAARAIQAPARFSGLLGDNLAVLPHVDRRTVHTRGPASRYASAAQRSTHLRRERLRSWFLRSLHGPFSRSGRYFRL